MGAEGRSTGRRPSPVPGAHAGVGVTAPSREPMQVWGSQPCPRSPCGCGGHSPVPGSRVGWGSQPCPGSPCGCGGEHCHILESQGQGNARSWDSLVEAPSQESGDKEVPCPWPQSSHFLRIFRSPLFREKQRSVKYSCRMPPGSGREGGGYGRLWGPREASLAGTGGQHLADGTAPSTLRGPRHCLPWGCPQGTGARPFTWRPGQ